MVLAVIVHVGPILLLAALPRVLSGPHVTPLGELTGYAGAFLAFSGLETFSQVSAPTYTGVVPIGTKLAPLP